MEISIGNILATSFGESGQTICASYKKTVNIKQYETEVIELDTQLTIDTPIAGAERALISAMLQAQLEYAAYTNLVAKGLVTETEWNNRIKELVTGVNGIKTHAEQMLGRSMDGWFQNKIG